VTIKWIQNYSQKSFRACFSVIPGLTRNPKVKTAFKVWDSESITLHWFETQNQVQGDNKVNSELQSKVIPGLFFCHSGLDPESLSQKTLRGGRPWIKFRVTIKWIQNYSQKSFQICFSVIPDLLRNLWVQKTLRGGRPWIKFRVTISEFRITVKSHSRFAFLSFRAWPRNPKVKTAFKVWRTPEIYNFWAIAFENPCNSRFQGPTYNVNFRIFRTLGYFKGSHRLITF